MPVDGLVAEDGEAAGEMPSGGILWILWNRWSASSGIENLLLCKARTEMTWNVYLSGEIHTDWREQILKGAALRKLPVEFTSAVTDHEASDAAGDLLGAEDRPFWRDHKSAKVNAMRTRNLIDKCDLAVVRFGEKYKQWNAAFDAGCCAALGKPYITLHDEAIIHPLKEVDGAAMAWAQTTDQVVEMLAYVIAQK
jgi:YtoQ family protein